MSYIFGESWDCYATVADMALGYWDSGNNASLIAGRFVGSQAMSWGSSATTALVKSSAVNDAVHHIVVAFRQTQAVSGTSLGLYMQLSDAATNQCCIVFRSDGTVLLTSATPVGTVLATYSGAVTAVNTWYSFEFEVVIHNTTGSFKVRKNGSTTDDHSTTGINTRPGANSYANKLTIAMNTSVASHQLDDLLWRSDAASVPWVGDVRCYTRMPASDASVQFAKSPAASPAGFGGIFSSTNTANGTAVYSTCTPLYDGVVSSAYVTMLTGFTGNMKCSLFAGSGTAPTTVLGSATPIVNPVAGVNTFTFSTPVPVVRGGTYFIGFAPDAAGGAYQTGAASGSRNSSTSYASFPVANPTTSSTSAIVAAIIITPANYAVVNEAQQDGTTSYVYDAVAGHADFYTVAALGSTPASTVAVTTRAFVAKSDAGTRTGAVQLKSGGSTVASPTLALSTSFGWTWRTDTTDPATSTAWTAAAVSACTIGPAVIA